MVGSYIRLAAAAALCAILAGCAAAPDYYDDESYGGSERSTSSSPLQCVPYAREHTGVAIRGDAYTWWDQAAGRYARASTPSEGAVMVLFDYAGPDRAHLAVVRDIIDQRTIRVDHANWLDDGAIYTDDPVRDVSAANDWSQVRVFNLRTGAWGSRVYPVKGFIGPGAAEGRLNVAQNPPPATTDADPIARLLERDGDAADGDNN